MIVIVHGCASQDPLEHVLALCVKAGDARSESVAVVYVKNHELEGIAVAAPGADVVTRPVAVVNVHLRKHILCETDHVHLFLDLAVLLVIFAFKVAAGHKVYQLDKLVGGGSVGSASHPAVLTAGIVATAVLYHINALGIDTIVGFCKAAVQTFAHVMNAEVFAIIEYNYLAASLVIHLGSFHEAH